MRSLVTYLGISASGIWLEMREVQSVPRVLNSQKVRHAEIVGEEMQLVLERHAAFLHRLLVERRKTDGVDQTLGGGIQAHLQDLEYRGATGDRWRGARNIMGTYALHR